MVLDERFGLQQQQAAQQLGRWRRQRQRTLDQFEAMAVGALVEPSLGGVGQQFGSDDGDVVQYPGHRTQLGPQFGSGGSVVGASVEGLRLGAGEVAGNPGMALCTSLFGQRVVGDFTHDVAAKTPPQPVDDEHPGRFELFEISGLERLLQRPRELAQRADVTTVAQHRGIVDHCPRRRSQLVEAGGDQRPQRSGQLVTDVFGRSRAGQTSELDQEQRVTTTAGRDPLDDRRRQVGAGGVPDELGRLVFPECFERQMQRQHVIR